MQLPCSSTPNARLRTAYGLQPPAPPTFAESAIIQRRTNWSLRAPDLLSKRSQPAHHRRELDLEAVRGLKVVVGACVVDRVVERQCFRLESFDKVSD